LLHSRERRDGLHRHFCVQQIFRNCSPGGGFTGQDLLEYDLVSGTGYNILGTTVPGIASCTFPDGSEQGCLAQSVGGNEVTRSSASGDLVFSTVSKNTLCLDLSNGPPFNTAGISTTTITGGTGKNAGATGTSKSTFHGQILSADPAFHGLSWFESTSSGTITTP
jgi:hypothetical protein